MPECCLENFEFLTQALDEYRDAFYYYDSQQPDLAARFDSDVGAALQKVKDFPESSPLFDPELPHVRRCTTHIFRFQVIYFVDQQSIKIIAFAHPSKKPGFWTKRFDS